MAARARIHATLVIAAALAATVASAEDRRLNIINEGTAPGTWQPVAETMAVPAYPGVVADKSEDVCVSIGYMIDDEGSTSDFAVLDAPSHLHLAYRPGVPLVSEIWVGGRRI